MIASLVVAAAIAAHSPPLPMHEWAAPAGQFAGQPPKGVVITIHGGGWVSVGAQYVGVEAPMARMYQEHGWATLNVDYRAGRDSYLDVVRFYDLARAAYGPDMPICASGQSAGGQLAMLLAALRPDLACAISEEGPATLEPLLAGQTDPQLHAALAQMFTPADGAALSPAARLGGYGGQILASYSAADTTIPAAPQVAALTAADAASPARVDVEMLPGAPAGQPAPPTMTPWVHMSVDRAALDAWHARQLVLLDAVAARR